MHFNAQFLSWQNAACVVLWTLIMVSFMWVVSILLYKSSDFCVICLRSLDLASGDTCDPNSAVFWVCWFSKPLHIFWVAGLAALGVWPCRFGKPMCFGKLIHWSIPSNIWMQVSASCVHFLSLIPDICINFIRPLSSWENIEYWVVILE
jgi:hypothetical protein